MSKRRGKSVDEAAPETLTPEERRDQRKRDRLRKKAGREPIGKPSPWRKVAIIGIPVAVIAVVAAVLVVANLPTPCISLVPVPAESGVPAFPSHTNPNFGTSWCPSASEVYGTAPLLTIDISGNKVSIPGQIGMNDTYAGNYECDLPIVTEPSADGLTPGTINILSDWDYEYNLSTFFDIWSETFSSVAVSSSATSQPIVYQSNDILGYTSNTSEGVYLFVDNQLSSQGPLLDISTLDNTLTPYPSCLGNIYGTGHTILITYSNSTAHSYVPMGDGVDDVTQVANPEAAALLFNGAEPHFGFLTPMVQATAKLLHSSLDWLELRLVH